jgi:hypothetical protein
LVSTMTTRNLPDIGRLASRMSSNHARVVESVDQLIAPIDAMVAASAADQWPQVEALGKKLAAESRKAGLRSISAVAENVVREASRPDNAHRTKRSLIRLIGTYGRTMQRQEERCSD